MALYTQYELNIKFLDTEEIPEEDIIFEIRNKFEDAMYGLGPDGCFLESVTWYNIREDMCEFSKNYNGVLFTFTCHNELGDNYRLYFFNGEYQECDGKIVYQSFRRGDLKPYDNNCGRKDPNENIVY